MGKEKEYYVAKLYIETGDIEIILPFAVKAENYEQACKMMNIFAENYYTGCEGNDGGMFSFFDNNVLVTYDLMPDKHTKEEWLDYFWSRMYIDEKEVERISQD